MRAVPHLVLASGSPRRRELLARVTAAFEVYDADVDESVLQGESPERHVARLAASKATSASVVRPGCVVVGADTTVALGEQMLGKPVDAEGAAEALHRLSGRTHSVFTGVAVATSRDVCDVRVEKARVRFGELDPAEIEWYLRTGEPMGKAGSYGLQGAGAVLVEAVEGDPTTVIGLPLRVTVAMLGAAGLSLLSGPSDQVAGVRSSPSPPPTGPPPR